MLVRLIALPTSLMALALAACGGVSEAQVAGSAGAAGATNIAPAGTGGGGVNGPPGAGTGGATAGAPASGGTPSVVEPGEVYGVAHGNGHFVAVGQHNLEGRLFTSENGWDWERRRDLEPLTPPGIAFGNGRFVVRATVGDQSRTLVSVNGTEWEAFPTPQLVAADIAFGNGVFITVGGGKIGRTTDGEVWETFDTTPDHTDVEFGGGIFVKSGFRVSLEVSGSGEEWTSVTLPPEGMPYELLNGVRQSTQGIVAWTVSSDDYPYPNSRRSGALKWDGAEWSFSPLDGTPFVPVVVSDTACVALALGIGFASGPDCTRIQAVLSAGLNPRLALLAEETYLVAGQFGIVTSRDGLQWTKTLGQ